MDNIQNLIKKAEAGDKKAQYDLGRCYLFGKMVEQNYDIADSWFQKVAEQEKSANVYYNVGRDLIGINNAKAEEYFEEALKESKDYLPYICNYHMHESPEIYFKWTLRCAEELNSGDYQYNLGEMYENGRGIEQDIEKAIYWYKKASENNDEFYSEEAKMGLYRLSEEKYLNVKRTREHAENGDIQAQYELALYYMDEMEENGESVFEAMYWLGKVIRHSDDYLPIAKRKEICKVMDFIRLCSIKVCIELDSDYNDLYKDEIANFISMTSDKVDAFIEDCKQKKKLRPQHYKEVSEDSNSNTVYYFVSPFPVSIKDKGFKESLVAYLTRLKATELWDAGCHEKAYAYLDTFWDNLASLDYRWVVNEGLSYLETKAAWYVEEQKWDKAAVIFTDILGYRINCDISQFAYDDEDIFEGMTENEQKELCESEFSCYNAYVSLIDCYMHQNKKDNAIEVASDLLTHFKTRVKRQDSWVGDWFLEQLKNENRKDDSPNLIRILKDIDTLELWKFCSPYCLFLENEKDENGIGNGYNWTREQYELIESMFKSVIPYIEHKLEDNADQLILAALNAHKGAYMMQTRRFAVAEKHLQIALSLLKDSLMVERNVCIPGIALTIGLFDDLYRVQNQKAEKQDYLWSLMTLFQENEKCEDYYLTLKEKLEQK